MGARRVWQLQGAIACAVSFDDYNVHVRLDWQGPPNLLHQVADHAHVTHQRQHNRLRLQFDH